MYRRFSAENWSDLSSFFDSFGSKVSKTRLTRSRMSCSSRRSARIWSPSMGPGRPFTADKSTGGILGSQMGGEVAANISYFASMLVHLNKYTAIARLYLVKQKENNDRRKIYRIKLISRFCCIVWQMTNPSCRKWLSNHYLKRKS